jgi:NitT/TauT family transport system ATP-binding protein
MVLNLGHMTNYIVKINRLSFSYRNQLILDDLNFFLREGEIGALIGVSGAGKTTFFNLMTGMLPPQVGTINIKGLEAPDCYNQISYMTQEDLLLPWRTVISNMMLSSELGKSKQTYYHRYQAALSLIHTMGLQGFENYYPVQLSGGMRQRVSLARALMLKRPLMLLDEPFGSLDVVVRESMYHQLRKIRDQSNTSMLFITHDFRDALSLADRVFVLSEGKISQEWEELAAIRNNPSNLGLVQQEMMKALLNSNLPYVK